MRLKNIFGLSAAALLVVGSSYLAFNRSNEKQSSVENGIEGIVQEAERPAKSAIFEEVTGEESLEDRYRLSNGMVVPEYLIVKEEKIENGRKLVVDTGYGPEFNLEIFDEGDGKPYHIIQVGGATWENGKLVQDNRRPEKSFDLTYRFCDEEGHGPYPIWKPTAFRGDPCYGVGPIKWAQESK